MYAAEFGSTGALEISVFQGLSVGKTAQPLIDPPTVPPLPELLPDPLPDPLPLPEPLPDPLLLPEPLLLDPLPLPLPLPLLLPEPLLLPPSGPTTGLPLWPPLVLLESSPPQAIARPAKAPVTASMPKVRTSCDILHIEHDECVWEQALARSMNIPSPPHVSTERRANRLASGGQMSASSVQFVVHRGKALSYEASNRQVANRFRSVIPYYARERARLPEGRFVRCLDSMRQVDREIPNGPLGHVTPRMAPSKPRTHEVQSSVRSRNECNRDIAHVIR